jgi:hypothetical protein
MVISIGGYWLDFGPFDYQEDLDEVFAHYGLFPALSFKQVL